LSQATLPGRIAAATVDHGLRAESATEAREVARICALMGVPHAILTVQVAGGNIQSCAREARYAALAEWMAQDGLAALATAHHADDQAETLLMRLNRASGVAGLAGVRARGNVPGSTLPVLRPLLDWRRSELAGIVEGAGLVAAQDPSNADTRFDRVRLRRALGATSWLNVAAIAASAGNLADADDALDWAARREWDECVVWIACEADVSARYCPAAPRAIRLRVIARIVTAIRPDIKLRGSALARLHDALAHGGTATLAGVAAQARGDGWTFRAAPPHRHGQETAPPRNQMARPRKSEDDRT